MAVADDRPQARGGLFALCPSDHDLITFVLHPMVARQQRFDDGDMVVHLADVYSVAPERLAERYAPAPGRTACWYFLCPARCRYGAAAGALGEGRWSSETGEVSPVVSGVDGRRVGHSRTLSYHARTTTVTRHGWCMELALDDEHGGGVRGGDFVLCKLFRSTHNEASSSHTATLLFDCKRKVAGDHPEVPPSVRQQLMQHSF